MANGRQASGPGGVGGPHRADYQPYLRDKRSNSGISNIYRAAEYPKWVNRRFLLHQVREYPPHYAFLR